MSKGGATKIIGLSGGLSIRMIPSGKTETYCKAAQLPKISTVDIHFFKCFKCRVDHGGSWQRLTCGHKSVLPGQKKSVCNWKSKHLTIQEVRARYPFLFQRGVPAIQDQHSYPSPSWQCRQSNSSIDNSIESAKSMHSFKSYAKVAKGSNTQRNHAQNHSNVAYETPNTLS